MLTIEDCLINLDIIIWSPPAGPDGKDMVITNTWDRRFISDVNSHIREKKPISTAQGELALKLIQRYREHLVAAGTHNPITALAVDDLIASPKYSRIPHQSTNVPREVRWVGNSKLAFRCKYNPIVMDELKKLKGLNHFESKSYPAFNSEHKLWIIDVNSGNYERVMELIRRHKFSVDDDVLKFFYEVANASNQPSTASIQNDQIKIDVRNDDLLNAWLNGLMILENAGV